MLQFQMLNRMLLPQKFSLSRFFPYRKASASPRVINPAGGRTSTRTPLLIALWPSLEVAAAELRHMAQPWLDAGVAHKKSTKTKSAQRTLISLPNKGCEKHPERKRSSSK